MHRPRSRHLLTLVSVLAAPTLAAAVVIPGVALAAKGPPTVAGTCTSLTGNAGGAPPPTVAGCTGISGVTTGTFVFPFASSGTTTITWNNGATTTFSFSSKVAMPTKPNGKVNKKFACPAPDTIQAALKGKISKTGNTGFGTTVGGFKGAVKATVCVDPALNLSLLAGTSFTL